MEQFCEMLYVLEDAEMGFFFAETLFQNGGARDCA